jgi:hypothetical protein
MASGPRFAFSLSASNSPQRRSVLILALNLAAEASAGRCLRTLPRPAAALASRRGSKSAAARCTTAPQRGDGDGPAHYLSDDDDGARHRSSGSSKPMTWGGGPTIGAASGASSGTRRTASVINPRMSGRSTHPSVYPSSASRGSRAHGSLPAQKRARC